MTEQALWARVRDSHTIEIYHQPASPLNYVSLALEGELCERNKNVKESWQLKQDQTH